MRRRTEGDNTLAGIGWFMVILAVAVAGFLLWPAGDGGADPLAGGLEVELRADIAAAREAGRVGENERDRHILQQSGDAIAARLRGAGHAPVRVRDDGKDRIFVRLPASSAPLSEDAKRLMTEGGVAGGSGPLAFRLVMAPESWRDTETTFEAWRLSEVLRWQQARSDGATYVPSREDVYVARRAGRAGDEAWDFVVLRAVDGADQALLGGAMLERPSVAAAERGRQTLSFRIKDAMRDRFRRLTAENVGRRLAIVVSGDVAAAPKIDRAIDGTMSITLDRRMTADSARLMAKGWLAGGPLRVTCFYVGEKALP